MNLLSIIQQITDHPDESLYVYNLWITWKLPSHNIFINKYIFKEIAIKILFNLDFVISCNILAKKILIYLIIFFKNFSHFKLKKIFF